MGKRFAAVLLSVSALLFAPLQSQDQPPTAEGWIRKLSSADFRTRDKATEELWRMGAAAEPALRRAAASGDAEAIERAKEILARFDAGEYPDTPPEVAELLRQMRSADLPKQSVAFRKLVRLGPKALPALQSALRRDVGADVRRNFFAEVLRVLRVEVPRLLVAGDEDFALELLKLNTYGPLHDGMLDAVVEWQRRDLLDAALQELTLRAAPAEAAGAGRRTSIFVRRAQGKHASAIADAEKLEAEDPTFQVVVDCLLEDHRAWAKLAVRPVPNANSGEGLKAYRLRNAGKVEAAKELLDLQVESETSDVQRNGSVDAATLALLLNDRTDDGLARMTAMRNSPQILADILGAKLRYRDALAILSDAKTADAGETFASPLGAVRQARLLHVIGERDRAAKLFDGIAAAPPGPDGFRNDLMTQLIRAEVRCGRFDRAAEHFGNIRQLGIDARRIGQDAFELIFEGDADVAQSLVAAYAREGGNGGAVMMRIRRLLIGAATPEEYGDAVAKLEGATVGGLAEQARADALASIQLAAGKRDDAVRTLTAAADRIPNPMPGGGEARIAVAGSRTWVFGTDESYRFWMDFADLLHDAGDDRAALKRLEQGLLHHPGQPILLYLAARSHRKLGNAAEGDRLCAVAHRTPLGNARLRGRFLEELLNRGDTAEAKIEAEQVLRCAWLMEASIGNVWNQVGRAAVFTKDFALARFAYSKAIHYLLRTPGVAYVEGTGYFSVPMNLKLYEVRELLAAGRIDEAVAKAKTAVADAPASTDLVIAVVPKLEALGRKADADAVFAASWAGYRKVLEAHPRCRSAQASAAWLAAGCRRELAAAEVYATAAAEDEPQIRFHREALAEVRFRRGRRAEAVALMAQLVREDRRNFAYKRQLERYRTADSAAPLPEADD